MSPASFSDFSDFEDDDAATTIGEVPHELISSLKRDDDEMSRATVPPPAEHAKHAKRAVDLDLDELLTEMDAGVPPAATPSPPASPPSIDPASSPHDRATVPPPPEAATVPRAPAQEEPPARLVEAPAPSSMPSMPPSMPPGPPQRDSEGPELSFSEEALDEDELLRELDELEAPVRQAVSGAPAEPDEDRPTFPLSPDGPIPTATTTDAPTRTADAQIPGRASEPAPHLPTTEPPSSGSVPPAAESTALHEESADAGAAAAKRTVGHRKPREEHFPLVGRDAEALAERRSLLSSLAEASSGPHRARLLVAAAELAEQLDLFDEALEAYRAAHAADPRDLVVLRALRRYATARAEWGEAAQLLEAEAGLALSNEDRAYALTLLAEIQMQRLADPAAAERNARAAAALRRGQVAPLLLLAETCFAQDKKPEGLLALEKAAESWNDPQAKAALLIDIGFELERMRQDARAHGAFQHATEAEPSAVDAWMGLARTARAAADLDASIAALGHAAEHLSGPLPEGLRRFAARQLQLVGKRPADATAMLADAQSLLALQLEAEVAEAAGDVAVRRRAVEAWVATAGGTDRALGLVALAELRAAEGDLDGADTALKDAALADGKLGTVRVMRELLARRAGDASRLARAVQTTEESALAAAAKTARDPGALSAERELLARAIEEGVSPMAADVLGLDAAASSEDAVATVEALRRQVERATPEGRLGPLLALARLFLERNDVGAATSVLREVHDLFPGDPLALRPLSRLVAADDPREAAALWLEEASASEGSRSAFAATWAGRILAHSGGDAAGAYRRAIDADHRYTPAAWALEPLVRAQGDLVTLEEIHERLADAEGDPVEEAGRRIRAALLRGARDPQGAVALLEQARQARPQDAIVYELMLRLAGGTTPTERASLLQTSAEQAPPEIARSARLRAAAAWIDAGEPARAAALYEKVLAEHPDDPFALEAVDRTRIAAGMQAEVSEHRLRAAKESEGKSNEERIAALEALADFDLNERNDAGSAAMSLEAILEIAPGHIPSLRALERYLMDHGRDDDLIVVAERLAEHLTAPEDVGAQVRMAARLRLAAEGAEGNAADEVLLAHRSRAEPSLWLARRVEGAARAAGDDEALIWALDDQAERLDDPSEKTSLALRGAEVLERARGPQEAAERLAGVLESTPEHPVAAEALGRLCEAAGDSAGAAEAYEQAAEAADVPRRQVALWYRAGVAWQDEAGDAERALAAYRRAADIDLKHEDLFDRMRALLTARDDMAELSRLVRARLEVGGDAQQQVMLHLAQADLCERLGDRDGAREALRAALALDADRVDALRRLATLCMEDKDWRGATEALIRVARLRQDREDLRWVFFHLGDIYDRHMPDAQRAEQAYRRVLKLTPDDVETMQRLAELYRREGNVDQAVAVLRELGKRDPDPDGKCRHGLTLARVLEDGGDLRGAEAELEQMRREQPTNLVALQGLADFYRRQHAEAALSMHLGRAVSDLRKAVAADVLDEAAWRGLVEVLVWRGWKDEARCCASAAAALGVLDIELARMLDPRGGIPGAGVAAAIDAVEEALAPPSLTPSTRRVFMLAAEAFDKVLPFDMRHMRAERAGRDTPVRKEAQEIMANLGGGDAHVYVTDAMPRACIPVSSNPVTILIGRDLLASTDAGERRFLLLRAAKAAHANLGVAVRSDPAQLAMAVGGLIRAYDPAYVLPGADPAQLDDLAKRIRKAIPRRARDELGPLLLDMSGTPGFDPSRLGPAASELGDRFALVALGSFPAGLAALLKTVADRVPGADRAKERAELVHEVPEAMALLTFALSDAHFAARKQAGADRL